MLSASRFNRRLDQIPPELIDSLFEKMGQGFHAKNKSQEYIIDSFPVPACRNTRIPPCLFQEPCFRGDHANMRCFVYGLKAHVVCEKESAPVVFFLTPASTHDLTALKSFSLKLPPHSSPYADKAYNDYHLEKFLETFA